jgi:hypothetical protein
MMIYQDFPKSCLALLAMPSGLPSIEIVVTMERKGKNATMKVADAGSRIDPDVMPKLFTRFGPKSQSGAGLGLFISKSIVEAYWTKYGLKIMTMKWVQLSPLLYQYKNKSNMVMYGVLIKRLNGRQAEWFKSQSMGEATALKPIPRLQLKLTSY